MSERACARQLLFDRDGTLRALNLSARAFYLGEGPGPARIPAGRPPCLRDVIDSCLWAGGPAEAEAEYHRVLQACVCVCVCVSV